MNIQSCIFKLDEISLLLYREIIADVKLVCVFFTSDIWKEQIFQDIFLFSKYIEYNVVT